MTPNSPRTDDCVEHERLVLSVFDRELPASVLESVHARECPECQRRNREAIWFLQAIHEVATVQDVTLPGSLADRVVPLVVPTNRTRNRGWRLTTTITALAASVAVVAIVSWGRFNFRDEPATPRDLARTAPMNDRPSVSDEPVIRVSEQVGDVREMLASLTRRTATEAIGPAETLLPRESPSVNLSPRLLPADAEPSLSALAEVPKVASSSLEPLTNSAERAYQLFLRDVGLASWTTKPKS